MNLLRRSQLHFVHCFLPGGGSEGPVPRPPAPPDAALRLDVPTLQAQLEGSQLLDALRLHRIGTPRPSTTAVCWASPTCRCCPAGSSAFHALLIVCLSPAPLSESPRVFSAPFCRGSQCLSRPQPEHDGCGSGGVPMRASGWTCTNCGHSPCQGERDLCRRPKGISCMTRGAGMVSDPFKHISAASLQPLPCPCCRDFSPLRAGPLVPTTCNAFFTVHRMCHPSQQPPPHWFPSQCFGAGHVPLGWRGPQRCLSLPRVCGSPAPDPVPTALPGPDSGRHEEIHLCLRGAR